MNHTLIRSVLIFGVSALFFLMAAPMSYSADTGPSANDAVKPSADKTSPVTPGSDWLKGKEVERPEIPKPGTRSRPPGMPEPGQHKQIERSDPGKFKHPEMSKREPKKGGSSSIKEMDVRIKALEEKLTALEGRIKELETKK